jgi:hypothetical protein
VPVVVFYGLIAVVVAFATARSVRRRDYGRLLRFYALVVVGVGGQALTRALPYNWADLLSLAIMACLLALVVADLRTRRAAA